LVRVYVCVCVCVFKTPVEIL